MPESNITSDKMKQEEVRLLLTTCMRFIKLSRMLEWTLDQGSAHMARMRLMLALMQQEENTLPELSRETYVSASSLCLMLKQLDKEGYVRRTISPADARITFYSLTEKGRTWLLKEYRLRCHALEKAAKEKLAPNRLTDAMPQLETVYKLIKDMTQSYHEGMEMPPLEDMLHQTFMEEEAGTLKAGDSQN